MQIFRSFAAAITAFAALPAWAAEPSGCDHFKWPLDHEKTLLATPVAISSGDAGKLATGENLKLALQTTAKLPQEPSRPPKFPEFLCWLCHLACTRERGNISRNDRAWRLDRCRSGWACSQIDRPHRRNRLRRTRQERQIRPRGDALHRRDQQQHRAHRRAGRHAELDDAD